MKNLRNFYKNKKILITGHTGFKGSWLAYALKRFGAEVYGYSLKSNHFISNFKILNLDKDVKNIFADIRDKKSLNTTINRINPDIIFHLAAQPLVKKSYEDPELTIETNVNGTLNILNASRRCKNLKSLVIITSDKCYKNKEKIIGYDEKDELGGDDPYSGSKASAEIITRAYIESYLKFKKNLGKTDIS